MKRLVRFDERLNELVKRDGRSPGQLTRKSAELFGGSHQQIPKATIVRWLKGIVKKPRRWQELIKLAIVLRLTKPEIEDLLNAASYLSLAQLKEHASEEDNGLLTHWDKTSPFMSISEVPFQVPQDVADFVGRTTEIHDLRVALQGRQGSRLFCFIGMAGVGKTSLAIHLATQLRAQFPDGVLWAQLDKNDPMTILRLFGDAYGYDVTGYADLSSRSNRIRDILTNRRVLVILDNAERDEDVRPLLPPKGSCTVFMTTRRHDLAVADKAQRIYLQPFSREKNEAIRLFSNILGEMRVKRELTIFAEMADLLGHLPLALAVAAYRLKYEVGWSANEFLVRLQQEDKRLGEIRRGDQDLPLSFALSYASLPFPLQQFFTSLGVFSGQDFDLAALASIAESAQDDTNDYLRQLCNLSLVQNFHADRFQLHPLLNTYVRTHLTERKIYVRLVSYYVSYARMHIDDYSALDREIGNLLLALKIAIQQGLDDLLISGVIVLSSFLKARGLYDIARNHLEHASKVVISANNPLAQATILSNLGHLSGKQGQHHQEVTYYLEALAIIRRAISTAISTTETVQMNGTLVTLLNRLGALAYQQCQFEQAHHYYQEALALASDMRDENKIISIQNNLGLIAFAQGHYSDAETYYQSALQRARASALPQRILYALQNLGVLVQHQGDYATAKAYFSEGLTLLQHINDPELMSRILGNLGLVAYELGNLNEAMAQFREGSRRAEQIGHIQLMCQHQTNMGLIAAARGTYRDANAHYRKAIELLSQQELPESKCDAMNAWGECHLDQGKWSEATRLFTEAYNIAYKSRLPQQKARSLYGLARLAEKQGNFQEAQRLGHESEQLYAGIGHKRASELFWWLQQLSGPTSY